MTVCDNPSDQTKMTEAAGGEPAGAKSGSESAASGVSGGSTHEPEFDPTAITFEKILEAHQRVKPHVHRTQILQCEALNANGKTLYFKSEHLQKTGAFKLRGATNAISQSDADVIVTHSSGNHAQAVALASKNSGKSCIVVMPKDSPSVKVSAVRDTYKATIRFCEPNQQARESTCDIVLREVADSGKKGELIHPYNNPRVACGQGTCAVELIEDARKLIGENLDAVVISVGGGGLLSGCATAIRGLCGSRTRVIAAEPVNANDCFRTFYKNRDGLKVTFRGGQMKAGKDEGAKQELVPFQQVALRDENLLPDEKNQPKTNTTDNSAGNSTTQSPILVTNPSPPKTVADSLKTNLGSVTFPVIMRTVDDVFQVSEDEIKSALRLVLERSKQVIEPGAAVAVAVARSEAFHRAYPEVKSVGVVLCGGNMDLTKLPALLEGQ